MSMKIFGVCGDIIIVSGIGRISIIIVSSNFGITMGGISDVLKWVLGYCGRFWNIYCVSSMNIGIFGVCWDIIIVIIIGGITSIIVSSIRVISVKDISQKHFCFFWCLGRFWNIDCGFSMNMGSWIMSRQGIGSNIRWEGCMKRRGQGGSIK